MNSEIKNKILTIQNNLDNYEDGFTLREEGIYIAATVLGIGMFDKSIVKLRESNSESKIGYFEIEEINGKKDLSTNEYVQMASEKIDSVSINFSSIDENGNLNIKNYKLLVYFDEIIKLQKKQV